MSLWIISSVTHPGSRSLLMKQSLVMGGRSLHPHNQCVGKNGRTTGKSLKR